MFTKSIVSQRLGRAVPRVNFAGVFDQHHFYFLLGGAIAASMAKKGGASITFPVFLAQQVGKFQESSEHKLAVDNSMVESVLFTIIYLHLPVMFWLREDGGSTFN